MDHILADKIRVKRAVEIFGLSESFVRHALQSRMFTVYKLGRASFVSRKEIEGLIEAGKVN